MGKFITGTHREVIPIREIPHPSEKRLVKRLELEYAYDHANPSMSADILLFKVVERYRFNDLLQVAFYFGLDAIKQKASEFYGDELPRRLSQILRNIENGFKEADLANKLSI
ncbi:hypothetical protein [Neptuniibacter caesariensis]|uniref:Uncharacterized protein n=1 Tax=Neptuniibacter caesariensis TaxID=207954 RepID=A0A7U8C5P1_NEPCE|nr:hypothetical protein [Neptuniibacter caesariensis]EAR62040.1 hypothetical protein MED92_10054 [Oceanospirillum sp. MED92] [Neptuniibacter caesariensis]